MTDTRPRTAKARLRVVDGIRRGRVDPDGFTVLGLALPPPDISIKEQEDPYGYCLILRYSEEFEPEFPIRIWDADLLPHPRRILDRDEIPLDDWNVFTLIRELLKDYKPDHIVVGQMRPNRDKARGPEWLPEHVRIVAGMDLMKGRVEAPPWPKVAELLAGRRDASWEDARERLINDIPDSHYAGEDILADAAMLAYYGCLRHGR